MVHTTKSLSDSDEKIDPAAAHGSGLTKVVVTVDHVYLPLDEDGNGRTDWAVTSVETTAGAQACASAGAGRPGEASFQARPGGDPVMSQRLLKLEPGNRRRVVVARGRRGQLGEKSSSTPPACSTSTRKRKTIAIHTTARATSAWWRASR